MILLRKRHFLVTIPEFGNRHIIRGTTVDIDIARDHLQKIIEDYELDVATLSYDAKIHHNSLYRFLKGEQDLSLSRWLKLVEALPPTAREEYLSVMFNFGDLSRLSSKAKKSILFRMVSEIIDNSKV